jgi:hypothetical protein
VRDAESAVPRRRSSAQILEFHICERNAMRADNTSIVRFDLATIASALSPGRSG